MRLAAALPLAAACTPAGSVASPTQQREAQLLQWTRQKQRDKKQLEQQHLEQAVRVLLQHTQQQQGQQGRVKHEAQQPQAASMEQQPPQQQRQEQRGGSGACAQDPAPPACTGRDADPSAVPSAGFSSGFSAGSSDGFSAPGGLAARGAVALPAARLEAALQRWLTLQKACSQAESLAGQGERGGSVS